MQPGLCRPVDGASGSGEAAGSAAAPAPPLPRPCPALPGGQREGAGPAFERVPGSRTAVRNRISHTPDNAFSLKKHHRFPVGARVSGGKPPSAVYGAERLRNSAAVRVGFAVGIPGAFRVTIFLAVRKTAGIVVRYFVPMKSDV